MSECEPTAAEVGKQGSREDLLDVFDLDGKACASGRGRVLLREAGELAAYEVRPGSSRGIRVDGRLAGQDCRGRDSLGERDSTSNMEGGAGEFTPTLSIVLVR